MQSTREYLKELIDRGNALQTPMYNPSAIQSAWQLANIGPSQNEIKSWERDVKAFSYRYLKEHYAYKLITDAFNTSASFIVNSVVNYLEKIYNDWEFWDAQEQKSTTKNRKNIEELLSDDIERVESFLNNPLNEIIGRDLYIEITGKYDTVIKNLGQGLYQYFAEQHFYDPEVSGDSLLYNLKVLLNKMISYQAVTYPKSTSKTVSVQGAKKTPLYDVFISHANADKALYVDELKKSLDKLKINIFYDKDTLEWGDNWKNKILEGVEKADFAIIVISENFFGREWTEKELKDFLNRQNKNGQKIILPILHNITVAQLQAKYPAVADIQALDSSKNTCDEIALKFAAQLIKRLKA